MKHIFTAVFIAALFMLCLSATADTLTLPADLKTIGEEAFFGDTQLDSVVLSEGVLEIGARAFADSSLKSINLPASLEAIADDALPEPGALSVYATEGNWAYDWAVDHGYIEDSWVSSPLEDFVIKNGIVINYLGTGGDVIIPRRDKSGYAVTQIGKSAFSWCKTLTSVAVPQSVISIEADAFWGCSALTCIVISAHVKEIASGAFRRCGNLTDIVVTNDNAYFCSAGGVLFNKAADTLICYPGGRIGAYTIPNSVTSIAEYAFDSCTGLSGITFPEGLNNIGRYAFLGCNNLKSVIIPNGVAYIEWMAFIDCTSLTDIVLPIQLEKIDYEAFGGCKSLTHIVLPSSLIYINEDAFNGCENLITVETEKDTYAYLWAVQHGYIHPEMDFEVYLLADEGEIAEENGVRIWRHLPGCFYADGGVADFIVVTSEEYTIEYNDADDANENDGFVSLCAYGADGQYYNYIHVNSGDVLSCKATGLSCSVYDNRSGAIRETSINFICGDKTITYTLSQMPILSSRLIAPMDMARYWENSGMSVLPTYSKADLVLKWASIPGVARYELCRLFIDWEDNRWRDRYERIGEPITSTTEDSFTTTIPASYWDEIGEQGEIYLVMLTFDEWDNEYKNHNFGDTQPEYCFRMIQSTDTLDFDYSPVYDHDTGEATGLNITGYRGNENDVIIPATINGLAVTGIAEIAFESNEDINSVEIPESVTRIGRLAFAYCDSLTHVTIPNTVTEIGVQAFGDCWSLKDIVIPESTISIGDGAFWNCINLTHITIPGNVIDIGSWAFEDCINLESVTIMDGVEWIGDDAFNGCTNLKDIYIPASVVQIEEYGYSYCFSGCDKLTIHGFPGSVAETYANEYHIPFEAISN